MYKRFELVKEYKDVSIDQFTELIHSDEDRERIQSILDIYENAKYETNQVPTRLTVQNMRNLLTTDESVTQYLWYLCSLEARKYHAKERAKAKKGTKPQPANDEDLKGLFDATSKKLNYGLWSNSMFLRVNNSALNACYLPNLIASAFFGQKLVIDLDFDECMKSQEAKNAALQVSKGWRYIRELDDPFDVWFCNANPKYRVVNFLQESLGMEDESIFKWQFNRTEDSYLSLFSRDKLVYLSPDAKEEMNEFDHNAIYIVGGLVDKFMSKPVTHAKCKQENLKCVKLPLDRYFVFKGHKTLTIDQVLGIISFLKSGYSMKEALEMFVPKRKLKTVEELEREQVLRLVKMNIAKKKKEKLIAQGNYSAKFDVQNILNEKS